MMERTSRLSLYMLILIFAVLVDILTAMTDPHGMDGIDAKYYRLLGRWLGTADNDLTSRVADLVTRNQQGK